MNNLQKRALHMIVKFAIFQEEARKCLRGSKIFQDTAPPFPWAQVRHLSQHTPGILVASILFFVARVEAEIERVTTGWDGKTLPLFQPSNLTSESLVSLQAEYSSSVTEAFRTLRERAATRYGNTEGDSEDVFLTGETRTALESLQHATFSLIEERLVPTLMRLKQDAH